MGTEKPAGRLGRLSIGEYCDMTRDMPMRFVTYDAL